MLNVKSFLTVDFGAGSLKLAEFEVNEAGGLRLKQFVIKSLGLEGSQETKREAVILKALQDVIAEHGIKAREVNVCAPGFHVFSKFVKLPPVDPSKVTQIIQYEAQQNVPFPLAEVVWDYQILGTTAGGELEVLLVAIKSDVVEGLFRVAEAAGLKLQVTDVSPAALCNAFRFNYGELEDCTMLLDIGAKTSNLLFFEKGKVFSRSINLGANSITQDFANESKLKFDPADKVKIDEGFVSLGGAYEEPENPHQAAISKIARQFMTRLHIQVNQTLQFYRGQQGGSAPARLFLAGGASIMPYTAQFFAEKLNVPVEYFNPFRAVQIDPAVNLEELARVAHGLGEVVGLGLRNLATCPVELNLMPESTLRWQSFNEKKPYFIATLASLVLMAFAVGFIFEKLAGVKKEQSEKVQQDTTPLQGRETQFKTANNQLKKAQADLEQITGWMEERAQWVDLVKEIRRVLINVEALHKRKLGVDTGLWIEEIKSISLVMADPNAPFAPPGGAPAPSADMPGERDGRYADPRYARAGVPPRAAEEAAVPQPAPAADPGGAVVPGGVPPTGVNTNDESVVTVVFRGVSLDQISGNPTADKEMAFAVQTALKESPIFDPAKTELLGGDIVKEDLTFKFGMALGLKPRAKTPP
ncbi:MAG: type IV pilus assembly protein PilM [Pedosphaera sp.]|nr:type IV pilus assembly protein PilM [Pedosphaera sp.]